MLILSCFLLLFFLGFLLKCSSIIFIFHQDSTWWVFSLPILFPFPFSLTLIFETTRKYTPTIEHVIANPCEIARSSKKGNMELLLNGVSENHALTPQLIVWSALQMGFLCCPTPILSYISQIEYFT